MLDKAPAWCSNAIGTNRGWVDPRTGEVLVSIKGIRGARSYNTVLNEIKNGIPVKSEKKLLTEVPVDEFKIEESVEPEILLEDKPKRRRKRKEI